ncbi:MAG: hypothetical protein AAGA56_25135, partial [Myxococcota bacterium]
MELRRRPLLFLPVAMGGCAAPPKKGVTGPPAPPATNVERLERIVTRAGLTWLARVSARDLWRRAPDFAQNIIGDRRATALAKRTGVDVRRVSEALLFARGEETTWIVRHQVPPLFIERAFRRRLTDDVSRTTRPGQIVLIRGRIGEEPRALALLGDVACFPTGGSLSRGSAVIANLYAVGKLKTIPTADTAAELRSPTAQAPFQLWLPGPFSHARQAVLRGAEAVSLSVDLREDDLRLDVEVRGRYPPAAERS